MIVNSLYLGAENESAADSVAYAQRHEYRMLFLDNPRPDRPDLPTVVLLLILLFVNNYSNIRDLRRIVQARASVRRQQTRTHSSDPTP